MNQKGTILILTTLTIITVGCSKPTALPSSKSSSSVTSQRQNEEVDNSTAIVPFDSRQTSEWNTKTFNLSYGDFSNLIQENYNASLNPYIRREDCDKVGTSADSRSAASQYRCGELPFGDIIDNDKKRVISIDIEPSSGVTDGFKYNIEGKQVHYYLERKQYSGDITIPLLDSGNNASITTSKSFGDDVFFRLSPNGNEMLIDACMVVPGMKTFSEPVRLNGKMKRDILITSLKANVTIDIDLGYMEFDSANICTSFALSFDEFGIPNVELIKIDTLKYENLRYEGHKIDVAADTTGLLSFISSLVSVFGVDIEEKIEKQVRAQVEAKTNETMDLRTSDIRSGKWASEFVDTAFVKAVIDQYSHSIQDTIKDVGLGTVKVKDSVRALCYAAISETPIPETAKQSVLKICRLAPQLNIDLFHVDQNSAQKGCYSYFFNPLHSTPSKWWYSSCQLATKIDVEIDPMLKPIVDCLLDSFNKKSWPVEHCGIQIKGLLDDYKSGDLQNLIDQSEQIEFRFNDINLQNIGEIIERHFGRTIN